jgi:hypothetical protein
MDIHIINPVVRVVTGLNNPYRVEYYKYVYIPRVGSQSLANPGLR